MREQSAAHATGVTHGNLRREVLRGHGKCKPRDAENNHQNDAAHNVAAVPAGDADVDNLRDNQRNQQFHDCLEQLEERSGNRP